MSTTRFSWDKHFSKLTWNEVYENSPFFHGQHRPTLFNPDRNMIYISSTDLDYSTKDTAGLADALKDVKSIFHTAKQSNRYYKMAMAQSDFIAIQGLLSELGVEDASHQLIEDSVS